MRECKLSLVFVVFLCAVLIPGNPLQASYQLEIFTSNGAYYDSPDVDTYVVVSSRPELEVVDFTFYNESLISSSLAGIYFDNGSLLGIAAITNGPGTSFSQPATPGDLPGGSQLDPPFLTTNEFCIDGDPPVSHNGVNPTEPGDPLEWVRVTFELIDDGTLSAVVDELKSGELRIGVHVMSLPDGSSESAVNVPAPGTFVLLGLGGLALLKGKRRASAGLTKNDTKKDT
jgi:hypothetical protein